ncbi:hypothetical protein QBC36DRAFT_238130 [Triangularia setosa]|uniref:J domain-containing protein n=1 Tax=Triangularia setosa TaxID=2587417 RepID=A0AAN6W7R6_9PEZI|nr:hypothetical protein QBC36DRAFT_238130 [Podospora setosa]
MFNSGAIYAVLMIALPLADFDARFPTPYSILGVSVSVSHYQIDDAYNDLLQTLQKQNQKRLWSGKGDQELLAKQRAEFHEAYNTVTDSLERYYWHRDTGVRDWYGVPAHCWDEIVKDKLQILRDAIAQADFSRLTWWPRSSKYAPFPTAQPPAQEPVQVKENSTEQEVPVTNTGSPARKPSEVTSVAGAAAKITSKSTSTKVNLEESRVSGIFDTLSRKLSAMAKAVVSATTQSVLASFPIIVSYSRTALAQAKTWWVILWAYICLVTTMAWSYLTTSFKLVRKYLMPLRPRISFPRQAVHSPPSGE